MFNPFRNEDEHLAIAIDAAYKSLNLTTPGTAEYAEIRQQITELYALQAKRVDPNVMLTVLGNTLITVAVLQYEKTGVITTKLLSFVKKS